MHKSCYVAFDGAMKMYQDVGLFEQTEIDAFRGDYRKLIASKENNIHFPQLLFIGNRDNFAQMATAFIEIGSRGNSPVGPLYGAYMLSLVGMDIKDPIGYN